MSAPMPAAKVETVNAVAIPNAFAANTAGLNPSSTTSACSGPSLCSLSSLSSCSANWVECASKVLLGRK